eukprot:PLAT221.4.p1 GENE.PLAT221.4~~PLAT221.4.p1  ORF type:complete len:534 (+),score=117.07 PLAT221.4:66-1604(+)
MARHTPRRPSSSAARRPSSRASARRQAASRRPASRAGHCGASVCKCCPRAPRPKSRHYAPEDMVSEFRREYVRFPLEARPPKKKAEYKPSTTKFDGTTTAHDDYPAFAMEDMVPTESARPPERSGATGVPFAGVSSTKADYPEWPIEARKPKKKAAYKPSKTRFEGKSTTAEAFPAFSMEDVAPVHSAAPKRTVPPSLPFEGTSTTRDQYRKWSGVARPAARKKNSWKPSTVKFEGTSTTRDEYKPIAPEDLVGVRKRPQAKPTVPKLPFEGDTEFQRAYKKWDVAPREAKKKAPYKPSSAKFEGTTTARDDYPAFSMEDMVPTESARPPERSGATGVPFAGVSSTKADYPEWPIEARKPKKKAAYKPSKTRFEGKSTTAEAFPAFNMEDVAPVHSAAPKRTVPPSLPFEGTSTTRDQYRKWSGVARPAPKKKGAGWKPTSDDRDFVSTTRQEYTPKELPRRGCAGGCCSAYGGCCKRRDSKGVVYCVEPATARGRSRGGSVTPAAGPLTAR